MPIYRAPPSRRQVLVRRSNMAALQVMPQTDAWQGWIIGLRATDHLRALFPHFYTEHVTNRSTTPRRLLGVVQAFLSLASQKVELLLSEDLEVRPPNPLAVLDPDCADDDALALIAQSAGRDISEIWPLVYGLDAFDEGLLSFGDCPPLLATICAGLAEDTAWASFLFAEQEIVPAVQRQLYQYRVDPATIALLDALPRLPADLPMESLCDALDIQPPLKGYRLGEMVRYSLHATGNQFADLSYETVTQMEHSGLDWRSEDLDAIGAQQRAAARLAEHYDQLNARMLNDHQVVVAFVASIQAALETLTAAPMAATETQVPLAVDV